MLEILYTFKPLAVPVWKLALAKQPSTSTRDRVRRSLQLLTLGVCLGQGTCTSHTLAVESVMYAGKSSACACGSHACFLNFKQIIWISTNWPDDHCQLCTPRQCTFVQWYHSVLENHICNCLQSCLIDMKHHSLHPRLLLVQAVAFKRAFEDRQHCSPEHHH